MIKFRVLMIELQDPRQADEITSPVTMGHPVRHQKEAAGAGFQEGHQMQHSLPPNPQSSLKLI